MYSLDERSWSRSFCVSLNEFINMHDLPYVHIALLKVSYMTTTIM